MFPFGLDPFQEFERELTKAVDASKSGKLKEPTAMSLATVDPMGQPNCRTVLFKGLVRQGLSFFTNYTSPKAQQLDANPRATLLFLWTSLEQQIRIEGLVEKVTRAESEAYFATRARESQIGAWTSKQSQEIPSLEYLREHFEELEERFKGKPVPCPEFWGGYRLVPSMMEFWFGRSGRLHERYIYERRGDNIARLESASWRKYLKSP